VPAWSEALIAYFIEAATDLEDAGLGADDVRQVAEAAARHMIDPTHPSQRSPGLRLRPRILGRSARRA
jgi:hypothetical protein